MKFSVIIPTYQRPSALRACLESFCHLDYPKSKWELIVVNDGGRIPNEHSDLALPLRIIHLPQNSGPAVARNVGASTAKGEYLAFTDDDCRPEKDWLYAFEEQFQNNDYAALGGLCLNPYPQNTAAITWQIYMEFLREDLRDSHGNPLLLLSNNAAYKRAIFEKLGGFDTSFPLAAAEDLDISHRLVAAGYWQDFCLEAQVWHEHQSTSWGFLQQQWRYGRGAVYFAEKQYALDLPLRKRGEFHWRLVQYLWKAHVPLMTWLLLALTPFAHRLGQAYERGKRKEFTHHHAESS